uniref:Uncharacterized protein n=1 Tax=Oryza glumipatula TaxID=40148 RepID=A0A0D9ZW10_9ORYZ
MARRGGEKRGGGGGGGSGGRREDEANERRISSRVRVAIFICGGAHTHSPKCGRCHVGPTDDVVRWPTNRPISFYIITDETALGGKPMARLLGPPNGDMYLTSNTSWHHLPVTLHG